MSNIFDRHYKKYDAWYDKHKFAYLSEVEALKKVIPKVGKGLEIGVGTGRFASVLGITMGIDPSRKMLEIASHRGVTVHWGFGENLPFWDSAFDYVAVIITLCFTKEPLKVLKEAWRVLKNNGKIIIAIVDRDSFLGKFYQEKKSLFYKQAHFFSVREIEKLLRACGFSHFIFYQTIFQLPNKMRSIVEPQKSFGKGGFVVISGEKR